jgi:hypothetical protein
MNIRGERRLQEGAMKNCDNEKQERDTYESPVLRVIELAADEVLATKCKATAAVVSGSPQLRPCWAGGCAQQGS